MGGFSMEEIDIHAKLAQIETAPHFSMIFDGDTEKAEMIAEHLMWLHSIRRERPLVSRPYKVGTIRIRICQIQIANIFSFSFTRQMASNSTIWRALSKRMNQICCMKI